MCFICNSCLFPLWVGHILKSRVKFTQRPEELLQRFQSSSSGPNVNAKKSMPTLMQKGVNKSVSFYTPSNEDYFYSLLYHLLVQKQLRDIVDLSSKVPNYLVPLAEKLSNATAKMWTPATQELHPKSHKAWAILAQY